MNKIDELINELCHDGVKFERLDGACTFKRGTTITASNTREGKIPVISGGKKPAYYHNEHNRSGETISVSGSGAYAGFVSYWDVPVYLSDSFSVTPIGDTLTTKYLYYFLKNKQDYIYTMKTGGGIPHIYGKDLAKLKIPLPPIEVQNEIVNILDRFVKLEAELEAELEAREKQYEFYRGTIFNPITKCAKLKKVAKLKNGKDWKHLNRGKYPVYGTGGVMEYVDEYVYNKPTVLIPRKGSINNVFYIDEPFWNIDTIYYAEINESLIIPKYFYYFITSIDLTKLDTGSGRPSLTQSILNEIDVPLPALEEQNKIISVLDKFEKLINDITIGLPAEIEMRKKQYEYYRDKLLTFEVLNNE